MVSHILDHPVYINLDPVSTLTYFMARSTWVAYAFEWVKLLKCCLKGKTCRKVVKGQDIDYSEEKKWPKASSASVLGLFLIIFKLVYWCIQQISGELLQDHWSSGFQNYKYSVHLPISRKFFPSMAFKQFTAYATC